MVLSRIWDITSFEKTTGRGLGRLGRLIKCTKLEFITFPGISYIRCVCPAWASAIEGTILLEGAMAVPIYWHPLRAGVIPIRWINTESLNLSRLAQVGRFD